MTRLASQMTETINPSALTIEDANHLLPDHGRYQFFAKPEAPGFVFVALDGEQIMGWYATNPAEALAMFNAESSN